MERSEILNRPGFWAEDIRMKLCEALENYMKNNNLNQAQLAEKLGFSKSYISQVLNGNFNYSIQKLAELALAIGMVPRIEFETIDDTQKYDKQGLLLWSIKERTKYFETLKLTNKDCIEEKPNPGLNKLHTVLEFTNVTSAKEYIKL